MNTNEDEAIVDLRFNVRGKTILADHGYALYSALCGQVPTLHHATWCAIHPIRGQRLVNGSIRLRSGSAVVLRVPCSQIAQVLPLAGSTLVLGGSSIILRAPTVEPLRPSAALDARNVVIKLTNVALTDKETIDKIALERAFLAELRRQLDAMGVRADPSIRGRQQVSVGGKRILGYSVRLLGLSKPDSLLVQCRGLGGKRHMGCGVFSPTITEERKS